MTQYFLYFMQKIELEITTQTQKHNVILENENKQKIYTCNLVYLLGSFLASYQVNLYIDEGERQGRRRVSWNWRLVWQKEGKGWLGWEEGEVSWSLLLFLQKISSLFLALLISINRFCLCLSFVEGYQIGRMPSSLECVTVHRVKAIDGLPGPHPSSCPYKYFYLHSVTVVVAYPFAFALSTWKSLICKCN